MGATGWCYFTPYLPNTQAALRQLQETVFRSGAYERPLLELEILDEMDFFAAAEAQRQEILSWYRMEGVRAFMARVGNEGLREKLLALEGAPTLADRDELQVLMELSTSGTGSILDMDETIVPARTGSGLYPLSAEKQQALWGTDRPTRRDIERWNTRISSLVEEPLYSRDEGFFVTVYRDDLPDEIYFEGASGD